MGGHAKVTGRSNRKLGVIGSAADLKYSDEAKAIAKRIGEILADKGCILIYGAEKDRDSLGTEAARGAKERGGTVVAITYGTDKDIYDKSSADIIIPTGLSRGGGREFIMVLACDCLIAIGGGSGTLSEIAMAYQADIPVVVIKGSGGWVDKVRNTYLDERRRYKIESAGSAEEAVEMCIRVAEEHQSRHG